jgi:hypothetical protein
VGPEANIILGSSLRRRIQNYEHKIRYESEYLFRMRKEVTTNYKYEEADKYHKGNNAQKNYVIFLLFNCRMGGKQWQTTPKNLPRMQRTRAIPVT